MCGVVEKTQGLYENNVRRPDTAYLEALAATGADPAFLISGAQSSADLTEEERSLLTVFRQADSICSEIILAAASAAVKTSQQVRDPARRASGPKTHEPRS
jgi:hypothetical protein